MTNNKNERPAVVVLVGLPASGKSTARAHAATNGPSANSYHYSTDDKLEQFAADLDSTYDDVFKAYAKDAMTISDQEVAEAIAQERGVIWDQTNMSRKKRSKIVNRFGNNYRKECICILPPFTAEQQIELERRLADRPGKNIPVFVIKSMLASFELPSMNEGFTRVLYFDIFGNMIERNQAADKFGTK